MYGKWGENCTGWSESKRQQKFLSGPVVKIPCFYCQGRRFNPWSGNWDPTRHMAKKKKKEKRYSRESELVVVGLEKEPRGVIVEWAGGHRSFWGGLGRDIDMQGDKPFVCRNPALRILVTSNATPVWNRAWITRNGNPLQYSCLEDSTDRGAWHTAVHEVAKRTRLSDWARKHTHNCVLRFFVPAFLRTWHLFGGKSLFLVLTGLKGWPYSCSMENTHFKISF